MTAAVEIPVRVGTASDRAIVRSLLVEARLPVEDLDLAADLTLWVAQDGRCRPVGAVGLQRHGAVALLRSLVVAPDQRRLGVGRALVRTVERHALEAGVTQLVLLTETAEIFFRRLGYDVIDRSRAPSCVASSAEFRTLCPSSALCMSKFLTPSE